jgi:hypothetical protein
MLLSNRWHVQLGEGGRRMTDSQIKVAAERCWIDAETPVRKPQSSEWTKLGDAAPARRITAERAAVETDIDTSAMILLSGEFEVVSDEDAPTSDELRAARPPRLAPKLFALALVLLAGGGLLAHRYVPRFDAELQSIMAAMRPAPLPTAAPAASTPPANAAPSTVVATVTSSATLVIVPKMQTPAPKMRAPVAPPAAPAVVEEAAPKAKLAQAKPKKNETASTGSKKARSARH